MVLGEKLSLLRKQNGYSQEELAEARRDDTKAGKAVAMCKMR